MTIRGIHQLHIPDAVSYSQKRTLNSSSTSSSSKIISLDTFKKKAVNPPSFLSRPTWTFTGYQSSSIILDLLKDKEGVEWIIKGIYCRLALFRLWEHSHRLQEDYWSRLFTSIHVNPQPVWLQEWIHDTQINLQSVYGYLTLQSSIDIESDYGSFWTFYLIFQQPSMHGGKEAWMHLEKQLWTWRQAHLSLQTMGQPLSNFTISEVMERVTQPSRIQTQLPTLDSTETKWIGFSWAQMNEVLIHTPQLVYIACAPNSLFYDRSISIDDIPVCWTSQKKMNTSIQHAWMDLLFLYLQTSLDPFHLFSSSSSSSSSSTTSIIPTWPQSWIEWSTHLIQPLVDTWSIHRWKKLQKPTAQNSATQYTQEEIETSPIPLSHPRWREYIPPCMAYIHHTYTHPSSTFAVHMQNTSRYHLLSVFRQQGYQTEDLVSYILKGVVLTDEHERDIKMEMGNKTIYGTKCSTIASSATENEELRRWCVFAQPLNEQIKGIYSVQKKKKNEESNLEKEQDIEDVQTEWGDGNGEEGEFEIEQTKPKTFVEIEDLGKFLKVHDKCRQHVQRIHNTTLQPFYTPIQLAKQLHTLFEVEEQ